MEQVLDVYKRPYDEDNPVVCMDESPEQLIEECNSTLMEGGKEARIDYESIRQGVAHIFMANEPLKGKRMTEVTQQKTKRDWAKFIKRIADEMYPQARKITLVMDNFKTHTLGAFYEAFEPVEAKRLADRFDFIFTPKHGSWLNRAEIELHLLNAPCLNRHIPTIEKEVKDWQFTSKDARIKLKRLYPAFEN
jgi:hypothetical protein